MKSFVVGALLLLGTSAVVFSLCSCTKRSTIAPLTFVRDSTIADTTYFIDFNLDRQRVFQIAGRQGWNWTTPWNIYGDSAVYPFSSLKTELDSLPYGSVHGFYFAKNQYGLDLAPYHANSGWFALIQPFVDTFFRTGIYNFASLLNRDTTYTSSFNPNPDWPRTQQLLSTGIHLIWFDSTGKYWETTSGAADQTGHSFTITKLISYPNDYPSGTTSLIEIWAKFECNLYDDQGNMKHLTNGMFHLPLRFKQFN